MSDTDIDDSFENDSFDDDVDARRADENDAKSKANSLEKRRLIDNILEEKRLERSLKDGFDDIDMDKDLEFDDDELEE